MLAVTAFHGGDADQALRQAQWLRELGGAKGHSLLLVADTACPATQVEEIRAEYAKSYDEVELLPFVDHYSKWPESPNAVFGAAARHIMRTNPQPWFFCEPDCIYLVPDALDKLWAEYHQVCKPAGKHFLGDFVSAETAGINVIDHCSGNMIVPSDLFTHAGLLLIADDVAFDVTAASQIVPQMHKSELIMHRWKAPPFESWEQVQQRIFDMKPRAVMFHANKTGELITLLREHKNLPVPVLAEFSDEREEARKMMAPNETGTSRGGQFICDIFIKTYPPDAPWLKYCLRSIDKFASGFRQVHVVTPENKEGEWTHASGLRVHEAPEHGDDGYLSQQVFKLYADTFTDADYILFTDSDTVFTKPITPSTYMRDGKIVWMMTPYAYLQKGMDGTENPNVAEGVLQWQIVTEKFLAQPVEHEFMRRMPFLVPRWLLSEMREFCQRTHGISLSDYVMASGRYSEFNCLGAYAYAFHRDKFYWINTEESPESEWPELTVKQKFSWGGLTPAIEAEFERILSPASEFLLPAPSGTAEGVIGCKESPLTLRYSPDATKTITLPELSRDGRLEYAWDEVPWADKESSLAEIGRLSARLKEFCDSNANTRSVRRLLHDAGIIQLPYLFKKRKGWKRKANK